MIKKYILCCLLSVFVLANSGVVLAQSIPPPYYMFGNTNISFTYRDFRVVPSHSGKCLDVEGASTTNGARIQQYSCLGDSALNQRWRIVPMHSQHALYPGRYMLQSSNSRTPTERYLGVDTSNPNGNNALIRQYELANNGSNMPSILWNMDYLPDGRVQFRNEISNKCLDVQSGPPSNGQADGLNVQQYDCTGANNQKFVLDPVYGYYQIKSYSSGKCLDVEGGSTADHARIKQWDCLGPTQLNQLWNAIPAHSVDGVRLVSRLSGKCIDLIYGDTANGNKYQQYTCQPGYPSNQIQTLYPNAGGYATNTLYSIFMNSPYQRRFDIEGNSTANGANLQAWEYTGGNNQLFYVAKP